MPKILEADVIGSFIFFLSFSNWSHITFYVWPRFQNFPLQLLLLWACLRNFTNNVNTHSKCSFWRYCSSLICRSFGRHPYMKILQLCHVTWSLEPLVIIMTRYCLLQGFLLLGTSCCVQYCWQNLEFNCNNTWRESMFSSIAPDVSDTKLEF